MTAQPFDPRGFLSLARDMLAAHPDDERYLRTAASRAYYGCFHLARMGLERSGRWAAGTVNVHERVIQELFARRRGALANGLRALRRLRERADYDLESHFDGALADETLAKAAALHRLLDTF